MDLTDIEKQEIARKLEGYLQVYADAIQLVQKYIDKFQDQEEHTAIVQSLKNGLSTLQVNYDRIFRKGLYGLAVYIKKFPRGQRPLIDLDIVRDFGKFLYPIGEDWSKEIMVAIHDINIYLHSMSMDLTDAEREEVTKKLEGYLQVDAEAIAIIQKYIDKFQDQEDYAGLARDLKNGLGIMQRGRERIIRDGVDGLAVDLKKFPRGNRGNLDIVRGFGDMLYGVQEEWANEIMTAVRKVNIYWNYM